MTDLSKLAAQRCAELVGDRHWPAGYTTSDGFRTFVITAHTLAQQAIADPSNAATILAPLVLVEPVDPVEERARELWEDIAPTRSDAEAIAVIANALRQGADHGG